MYDQRPCPEFSCWQEIIDDSLTATVMNADRVDRGALINLLEQVSRLLPAVHAAAMVPDIAA